MTSKFAHSVQVDSYNHQDCWYEADKKKWMYSDAYVLYLLFVLYVNGNITPWMTQSYDVKGSNYVMAQIKLRRQRKSQFVYRRMRKPLDRTVDVFELSGPDLRCLLLSVLKEKNKTM